MTGCLKSHFLRASFSVVWELKLNWKAQTLSPLETASILCVFIPMLKEWIHKEKLHKKLFMTIGSVSAVRLQLTMQNCSFGPLFRIVARVNVFPVNTSIPKAQRYVFRSHMHTPCAHVPETLQQTLTGLLVKSARYGYSTKACVPLEIREHTSYTVMY